MLTGWRPWIPCDLSGERTLADIDHLPYNLGSREDQPVFNVKRNGLEWQFPVEDVYARIFANLRRRTEVYLGKEVTHAVITAPTCFNVSHIQSSSNTKNSFSNSHAGQPATGPHKCRVRRRPQCSPNRQQTHGRPGGCKARVCRPY